MNSSKQVKKQILSIMKSEKISLIKLSSKMEKYPDSVKNMLLNPNRGLTLKTVDEFAAALGCKVVISLEPKRK